MASNEPFPEPSRSSSIKHLSNKNTTKHHIMKISHILTAMLFATTLGAAAQLPAKRALPKKEKSEVANGKEAAAKPTPSAKPTPAAPAQKTPSAAKATSTPEKRPTAGVRPGTATPTGRPGATTKPNLTGGSVREFPTAATMPTDAAWRRDIYRTIDLTKEKNAALYFPVTPTGGRQNLFVYLFRQVLRGSIKAYEYTLDANEHFDEAHQIKGKKIMDTHNIYYEEVTGDNGKKQIRVNDADLPSEEVKLYFVKESVYYDQHTASFRTKVTAICPVMVSGTNDFGEDETQRVPLFWVNYEEAAPYLAKLSLMGSSMNNAAAISADDYFTMNRYEGDIYKTTNLQDRIIAQYAETEDEQVAERKRIESELGKFESHVWGHEAERLLDTYGNPVLDTEGKPITFDEKHQLIDSRGRRIAFAIAGKDSLNVASSNPEIDPLPTIVLLNERGFAVDANGQPLLKADGTPVEFTDEYPTPGSLEDGKKKAAPKSSTTPSRRTTSSSSPTRRTSPASTSASKTSAAKSSAPAKTSSAKAPKSSTTKTKAPKPSKGGGSGNTISVRKERH